MRQARTALCWSSKELLWPAKRFESHIYVTSWIEGKTARKRHTHCLRYIEVRARYARDSIFVVAENSGDIKRGWGVNTERGDKVCNAVNITVYVRLLTRHRNEAICLKKKVVPAEVHSSKCPHGLQQQEVYGYSE